MRELFVWYRVHGAHAGAARAAVFAMQAALAADIDGLACRLLARDDDDAPLQTWMETYARPGHDGGIDAGLQARIEARAQALGEFIEGGRHGEAFAPLALPDQIARSIST